MALANVDDAQLASTITVYLRDASPDVRRAAAEALLWDADRRWLDIRQGVREAFSDPRCVDDGPLPISSTIPTQLMVDLSIWAGQSGLIATRATTTLISYFHRELNQNPSPELVDALATKVRDGKISSSLRVEYAQLLADQHFVDGDFWRLLLNAGQPSFLRLLAAGALLREGQDAAAVEALRDVAKVPNREIALQIAAIVQKFLRFDMGLPLGGTVPEAHSKLAAEVARRVIEWAADPSERSADEHPSRRTRLSSPGSSGSSDFGRSSRWRF
jgi:hypothetical protein